MFVDWLDLGSNKLSGPIPSQIGSLTSLSKFLHIDRQFAFILFESLLIESFLSFVVTCRIS